MTIIPPYLKKGDTIGIVCPAGFMPFEKAETCIRVLQEWGFNVRIGKTLRSQYHYFSGTDQQRCDDLQRKHKRYFIWTGRLWRWQNN
jgi:muramoyltetrapeptide carboxypeptidase